MLKVRTLALFVLVVVGVGCLAWLAYGLLHTEDDMRIVRNHFVDADTLLFERHTTGEFPPLPGSDGHEVVIARCFQVEDRLTIGWLERYPVAVKQQLDAARDAGTLGPDLLVGSALKIEARRVEPNASWVTRSSAEGAAICVAPKLKDGSDAIPAQPAP